MLHFRFAAISTGSQGVSLLTGKRNCTHGYVAWGWKFENATAAGQLIGYAVADLESPDIKYIMGAGHGFAHVFQGDMGQDFFRAGKYLPAHVAGRIVHLTSCYTARELGPDFVENGCLAFFGYDDSFIIPGMSGFREALACDGEIDVAFAEGLTAMQVYKRVMEKYEQAAEELAVAGEFEAEAYLLSNRDSLRAPSVGTQWGDLNASL